MVSAVGQLFNQSYHTYQTQNIYSLKDNVGTQGSFVLGSGEIDSTLSYYYIIKQDGGFKVDHVDSDSSVLIYSNSNPKLVTENAQYVNGFVKFLFLNPIWSSDQYKLFVPNNTIKTGYSVNLK